VLRCGGERPFQPAAGRLKGHGQPGEPVRRPAQRHQGRHAVAAPIVRQAQAPQRERARLLVPAERELEQDERAVRLLREQHVAQSLRGGDRAQARLGPSAHAPDQRKRRRSGCRSASHAACTVLPKAPVEEERTCFPPTSRRLLLRAGPHPGPGRAPGARKLRILDQSGVSLLWFA